MRDDKTISLCNPKPLSHEYSRVFVLRRRLLLPEMLEQRGLVRAVLEVLLFVTHGASALGAQLELCGHVSFVGADR